LPGSFWPSGRSSPLLHTRRRSRSGSEQPDIRPAQFAAVPLRLVQMVLRVREPTRHRLFALGEKASSTLACSYFRRAVRSRGADREF